MAQSRAELKLLTLNTHSWQEKDNEYCLRETVRAVLAERPDVIALQEVNQRRQGQAIAAEVLKASGFVPGGIIHCLLFRDCRRGRERNVIVRHLNPPAGISRMSGGRRKPLNL